MNRVRAYFRHHTRFYTAVAAGALAYGAARIDGFAAPLLLGGNVFFLIFLIFSLLLSRESAAAFAARADSDDEGVVIVMLVTLAVMGFFSAAVFGALDHKHGSPAILILSGVGALLGWCVMHCVMAFHYANLHYFDDPETTDDDTRDLDFPGCAQPGPWDFFYFSFVVGMTAQVSDVQVKTTAMRRAVLGHGIVSFFFNTVFIAMAVNAAVALAS